MRGTALPEGFRVNGPTRERGGLPDAAGGSPPSTSVDVLAAQVRVAFDPEWYPESEAALDALVAQAKTWEEHARGWRPVDELVTRAERAESERDALVARARKAEAALAYARNALAFIAGEYVAHPESWRGKSSAELAREVLARLDGSSGE